MSSQQPVSNKLSSRALKTAITDVNSKTSLANQKKHEYNFSTKFTDVNVNLNGSATLNSNKKGIKNSQNPHQINSKEYQMVNSNIKKPNSFIFNNKNENDHLNKNKMKFNNSKAHNKKQQIELIKQQRKNMHSSQIEQKKCQKLESQSRQKYQIKKFGKFEKFALIKNDQINLLCEQQYIQNQEKNRSNQNSRNSSNICNKLHRVSLSELKNQKNYSQKRPFIQKNHAEQKSINYQRSIISQKSQEEVNNNNILMKERSILNFSKINMNNKCNKIKQMNKNMPLIIVNHKQQLKKFLSIQKQINFNFSAQSFCYLEFSQKEYQAQPNYIEIKQKALTWQMRAKLIDWMMHVCYEFCLKRDTFYIAVGLVDRYFEKVCNLRIAEFQLLGAAALFISSKLEQKNAIPSGEFALSTGSRYNQTQVKRTEIKICKVLNFELNHPTLSMWSNKLMTQWDVYLKQTDSKIHQFFKHHALKYFKQQTDESYANFRMLMQYVDCMSLDIQTHQFSPKMLICSLMYLILGKMYKQWTVQTIVKRFPYTSTYLIGVQSQYEIFNDLFQTFVRQSFCIELPQLLPSIQYCATFFILQLGNETPLIQEDEQQSCNNLEQYCSYQTHNSRNLQTIYKRIRQIRI